MLNMAEIIYLMKKIITNQDYYKIITNFIR